MNSLEESDETGALYRPLYFGCVEFVDSEIGRVLEAVDTDETVIGFTSDHGHYLGAHGLDLKHFAPYDEVVNVPFVLRGPSIDEGATTDALISHVDIVPTVLKMAGGSAPTDCHGMSFIDVIRDPDRDHRDAALIEYNGYGQGRTDGDGFYPVRCIVSDDGYKLCLNLFDIDELYEHDTDPEELYNRIGDDALAQRRDGLHDRPLAEMETTDDAFHGQEWANRAWREIADPIHPG